MALKKSKFATFMRFMWCVLMAAFVALLVYRLIDSTIDQRSGPFAYFKDLPGDGSAFDRGKAEVDLWIGAGNNGLNAIEKGRKSGFNCGQFRAVSDEKAPAKLFNSCQYKFGFFGERWYFVIFIDKNYTILHSDQYTIPLIGL